MKEKCCNSKNGHNHDHKHNCSNGHHGQKGKESDMLLTDITKLEERKACLQERINNIDIRIAQLSE